MRNHTCDDNCTNCDLINECDHVHYEQFNFAFDIDTDTINWDDIPELDVAPEASEQLSNENKLGQNSNVSLQEIEIQERTADLEDRKSSRALNEFLKKYASKLLKYSIFAIIGLYMVDLIVTVLGKHNSKFADPLFTLLQMIITTVIGYLIGSNQNKD